MNPKVIVASLVLVLSLASIVSIGVTESWFSDSDESQVTITTASLVITIGNESYKIGDDVSSITGNTTIKCNYSVKLSVTEGRLVLINEGGLDLQAGVEYTLEVGDDGWIITQGGNSQ